MTGAWGDIEAEVEAYAERERRRLGLEPEPVSHWRDSNPQEFRREDRSRTTILFGGLTVAHDQLVRAALAGLGYQIQALDVADTDALHLGKEYGNRGQCNPTYFTVGNLIKHLIFLRDEVGLTVDEIVRTRVFFTAGACGPCRFGTYVTEYRKALRDAGFDGFRVLLFQQQGGLRQATGTEAGLDLSPRFFLALLRALLLGDALNLIGYRIRPYERETGETDRALERCKGVLAEAFEQRRSLLVAAWRCRRLLGRIPVRWLTPKPKVAIIGEFWAMTTEGDGNYRLQRFLESEGAEVDIQPLTAWLLYNIWEHAWDTRRRLDLRGPDGGPSGFRGQAPRRKLIVLRGAEWALRAAFDLYAHAIGLKGYRLSNMDEIAAISHQYYDNHLRGGEGHMEVGKLIQYVQHRKAHMVISVKPFGCMPSSGVSDGVQSLVAARYPEAVFSAIETTGDGAVNAQSRILMDLFRARRKAEAEYDGVLSESGLSPEQVARQSEAAGAGLALDYPPHHLAGTACNDLVRLVPGLGRRVRARLAAPGVVRPPAGGSGSPRPRVVDGRLPMVSIPSGASAGKALR